MGSRPCLTKSQIVEQGLAPMKLSIRSTIIAGALFKAVVFLFISLLNLVLRPYGGAYLALLTSLYSRQRSAKPSAWHYCRYVVFVGRRSARRPAFRLAV